MYCSKCGADNADSARFCSKCGEAIAAPRTAATRSEPASPPPPAAAPPPSASGVRVAAKSYAQGKNPVLALILGLLIPGVAQFYNGDVKKGALMLVAAVVLVLPTLGLAWAGIAIWSAIDGHQVASGKTPLWT